MFNSRMRALMRMALAAGLLALTATVQAETIAIIGTGNVAGALGPEFAALGHTIVYGSRTPDDADATALVSRTGGDASVTTQEAAVRDADVVVLAVPGTVAESVVRSLGDLSGKILIDPTNRVGRGGDYLTHDVPGKGSNAELIQAAAPGARVVKAFNTLNVRQMVDPETAGGPISIPIVGADEEAKAFVATLASGMGLEPIDLGPLAYAHVLEEMLVVWGNSLGGGNSFNWYLRPMPSP